MLSFTNPLRWLTWPSLGCYFSSLSALLYCPFRSFFYGISQYGQKRAVKCVDVEKDTRHAGTLLSARNAHEVVTLKHRPAIRQSKTQKLIMISIFAEIYLVDGQVIRKAPRSLSKEDTEPIRREATIYSILGDHPRIAQCLSLGCLDYVDIKYYHHGDIVTYCRENDVSPDLQARWFQQIIEAVAVIHKHGIIHSDLALRQLFVDSDLNVRLGDFNSSQYPGHPALGFEKASHCLPRDYEMPNTVTSDLFALGSTLYELVAGSSPYQELYPLETQDVVQSSDPAVIRARFQRQHLADCEVEERFRKQVFPDVLGLFGGDVILGCWEGRFSSAEEALSQFLMTQTAR